jgi:hypothetical protein
MAVGGQYLALHPSYKVVHISNGTAHHKVVALLHLLGTCLVSLHIA